MHVNYYVFCPENVVTGGTELLHQFADYVNSQSEFDAYIVYYNSNDEIVSGDIPERFKIYNTKSTTIVEDNCNNILVFPEVAFYFSKMYNNTRFLFWWLSFDNYLESATNTFLFKRYIDKTLSLKQLLVKLYCNLKSRKFSIADIKKINERIIHCYQSQYVHHKLFELGFYNQLPLSDYISTNFFEVSNPKVNIRENIILYNPAKGFEVTKKILKNTQHKSYSFIALKDLNQHQLSELFSKAKLYIDFGNHPGKDRLPREAALQGCLILVGNNGSAKYFEDLLLNSYCKVNKENITGIVNKIEYFLNNYEKESGKIELYKSRIQEEKKEFFKELEFVLNVFEKMI
ncbi:hypothetical protein [Empedobacter sp.]|uniref:hypothetical protein n=1 Tax=Empedobacter sp. TaxID=1927715 RepID=UPI00289B9E3E|nr:hypothetical protein [Empedobacter sp.]